ncbi:hypothetical protein [Nocardioides limicola]|uniref:hypothetical protein n=1 Tax=Nocardioides limicola TaxID=2803368 RepID=UPI00193BEF7A|nr:hypothetical protein [Nocardioides sp. DJM-14]
MIDAVCMRLSAAIEALSQLEVADRDRIFGETWPLMWATHNRIAHGDLLIDSDIITATLDADVPMVIRTITRALNE